MEEKLNENDDYTIVQASQFLSVSTKTIHNYIKKGILKANKWNGMWFVENRSIIEMNSKINRTKLEFKNTQKDPKTPHETSFWVDKEHYEELLRQAGQIRAAENLLIEYKSQNQGLLDRIKELEKALDRLSSEGKTRGFWKRLRRDTKTAGQGGPPKPT